MGKIPPSLRSAITNKLLHKTPSNLLQNPQSFPQKTRNLRKQSLQVPEIKNPKNPFNSPDLNEAKKLFSLASKTNLDIRFNHSFLQSYAKISTFQDSVSLFNYMVKNQPLFTPDRSTYHILLSAGAGRESGSREVGIKCVRQVLNMMVSRKVEPNQGSVDIAVRGLCSVNREDEAVELVKELASKGVLPDQYSFNYVVKCLCKSKALSSVYGFLEEMRESFGVKPNLMTYTILIDSVCNSRNLREALRLVSVLGEEGFKPDCFVYNTIMKGYCMLSKGSEVLGVYKKMQEEGVEPDLVTYNTLIFGLSKSGRVKEARAFLKVMAEMGHFPDAVTYTSLMNGMCRERDALGALALLGEMESRGCTPNTCTYNTLLHGLCKTRHLDKGMELYGMMKESGMLLESASYGTLLRALCREGRVAEAYGVFDYAVESKSVTDATAYTTLETTLKWLKKAREQGLAV